MPLGEENKTAEPQKEEPPKEEAPKEFAFDEAAFKLPEGVEIDEATKSEFLKLAKENEISPEKASALAAFHTKIAQANAEAQVKQWINVQEQWRSEVQKHPDFGGDKLPAVMNDIGKIVDKYGSPEFREVMTLTGAGNHPEVVAFFHRIAKDLVESAPVVGAPASTPKSLAEHMFSSMKQG